MAESIISPGVFVRENDISFIQPAPITAGAAFLGPTVKGLHDQPTIITSYNEYVRKFGETFLSSSRSYEFLTSIAVKNYFSNGGQTALVTRIVSGNYTPAVNTFMSASTGKTGQPFELATIGTGILYNNAADALAPYLTGSASASYINSDGSLVSGSKENVRWEIANVNSGSGTFTLLVRQGDDSTNNKVILETFNADLDPNSPNYIERIVGNQTVVYDTNSNSNRVVGEYPNRSNYIRVSTVNFPTPNYIKTDGINVNVDSSNISYSASLPSVTLGSFHSAAGTIVAGAKFFSAINQTGNIQGLVGGNYDRAINILENKDDFQFNVITAPGVINRNADFASTLGRLVALAENRGDCIAVVDLVETGSAVSLVTEQAAAYNSSYAATYWPWVQVQSATGKNEYVPAGTMIPGVYAFTDASSAPWFAPAGLIRGGIGGVIQAERKLTKGERDILYAGKVNPIASFPGTGISIMGQKTLQTKASALDRVNVRRLLIELKKFIGDQARNLVFEQNTIATRNRFLATVNPYLESIIQRQGLFAYRVVMDDTNNTADVVDRNQLVGQIFIQPTKTIEFVVLDFTVEPTGATFG
jgi:phage tail sheath protein FI